MVTFRPPRPSPLGRGRTLLAAEYNPDLSAFTAQYALFPLPEGEGQGDGGTARTTPSRIGPLPELSNWTSSGEAQGFLNDNEFKSSGTASSPSFIVGGASYRDEQPDSTAHSLERTLGANDRGQHAAQRQKFILLELT